MKSDKWKVKGIFLDLDGTLVDSRGAYLEAGRITFKALGKKVPEPKMLLEIPRRMEQQRAIDDLIQGPTKHFMKVYLRAYYSVTEAKTKLMPNVSETLETLSEKAKLALITMRYCSNQILYKELDFFGISKYFSHIVTAMDTAFPKPSPEALIQCVENLDLEMSDCIIVGDSINDIRAGKAAGTRTVALLSGLYQKEELVKEKPDLILPDVSDLPKFVN